MNYLNDIKEMCKNFLGVRGTQDSISKIKKSIIIKEKKIRIENMDMTQFENKNEIIKYLVNIFNKYPSFNVVFSNCNIEGLIIDNITINNVLFDNCVIKKLKISERDNDNKSNTSSIDFQNCTLNFENESHDIEVEVSRVELNDCIVNIEPEVIAVLNIGKKDSYSITLNNITLKNKGKLLTGIKCKNLRLSNSELADNSSIVLSSVETLHLSNSNITFDKDKKLTAKVILIDDSNVSSLTTECESIEFSGANSLKNVDIITCDDILVSEETSLTTEAFNVNANLLECRSNSQINDLNNRFKWLTNIKKVIEYSDFKLIYNGKVMYVQKNAYLKSNTHDIDISDNLGEEISHGGKGHHQ